MSRTPDPQGRVALAAGPIAALITAGVLARFRTSGGSANVALLLAGIVVAAALAGRLAGFVTAITAALAYNYFHTVPYNSLQIRSVHDIVTVVMLALLGVGVSELGAWRRRIERSSQRARRGALALERTSALLASRAPVDDVWDEVQRALIETLGVAACRFEPGREPSAPVLARSGSMVSPSMTFSAGGFQLPEQGVAIAVADGREVVGHVVLVPSDSPVGSHVEERKIALALVDQYATARALHSNTPANTNANARARVA